MFSTLQIPITFIINMFIYCLHQYQNRKKTTILVPQQTVVVRMSVCHILVHDTAANVDQDICQNPTEESA